jgi:hypothetical protein
MPQALATFINNAISIADKRNLAKENPIVVTIPQTNAEEIITVVSFMEPNHVTLPFNVTWIVADPASSDYKRALRRVSALPFGGRRNTWATLTVYQDILDEPQFYDRTATFSLGEVETTGVLPATAIARGVFKLLQADTNDAQNPVVVGDNDPRMTDARMPVPHGHPLLPAIALEGSSGINDFYVTISDSAPPTPGQALMITGTGTQPNEYKGIWRTVVAADIEYDGPTFDSLTINGPLVPVEELQPVVFSADAHFSDSTMQLNVPCTWSIIANGSAATISATTGTLNSADIVGDQVVRVQARYLHPESGQVRIQTFDLTILDVTVAKTLVSIAIQGPADVNENSQASYTVIATYDDNSTAGVSPDTFTSSNSGVGSFASGTGVLTVPELLANQSTTLSAAYTENGVARSATKTVTAHDLTVYPQSAVINGPTNVPENSTATYTMTVTFTDLSSQVVAISNWASSNLNAGTINAVSGVLTTPVEMGADEASTISASYTNAGRTVSATLNITSLDTTNYPESATIIGATSIDEGSNTTTYQLEVTFTDNTTAIVPVANWTSTDTALATIDSVSGVLTSAANIKPSGTTTISASYTAEGRTVSATEDVIVNDTTNYPVSAQIVGSGSMNEGTVQNLILRVTYLDSSVADVVTNNWNSSNPAVATVDSATGILTSAANVIGNQNTQITCSYIEHGEQVTPTALSVNIIDITAYPVSAVIEGLSTVSESTTTTYQLRVTFDNSTNSIQPVSNWAIDNGAAGTINASTGVFNAAPGLLSNELANITASYTLDGNTVNATKAITVTDDTVYPASAVILGANTVDETTTSVYQMSVTFTDATVQTVSISNWAVDNTGAAGINANTGLLSALDVVGDKAVNITGSYTAQGVTVNATKLITVRDLTVYPVSAAIIGNATVAEGSSATYQMQVTYDDASTAIVGITNWVSDNLSLATINATTGVLQATANVVGNQVVNISASYTQNGVTVNGTTAITVSDTTAYPVSAVIVGNASVAESTSTSYTLSVTFSDMSVSTVTVSNWAIDNGAAGTINASTGVFVAAANNTKVDIVGNVSCSYTLDGTTVTPTPLAVSVIDTTAYPVSARIVGPAAVAEGSALETYLFEVTFSDASVVNRNITDWASSNPTAGTIVSTTGAFTAATDNPYDEVTQLSGSFTENGDTVTATLDVTVTDVTVYPASLAIIGSTVVNESDGTVAYTAQVTYINSSTAIVSVTDWAMTGSAANVGTINATTGVLTLPTDVVGDQSSTLTCSYTEFGITVNASQVINIVDDVLKPVSAAITGPATVDENDVGSYVLTVTYDDSSTAVVSATDWASSNGVAGAIVATTGAFTANTDVPSNQVTNLTASYTENGVTVNATLPITVIDTTVYVVSAQILGTASMDEGDSATYQLQVTYQDTSTAIVSVTDWASSNPTAGAINATSGVFIATADVTGNQSTTLTASYTENSVTVTGTRVINVLDTTNLPVSVAITGPATINENEVASYVATVTYQDASTVVQTTSVLGNWTRTNALSGNIGSNTGQFGAIEVAGNQATDITFTFTQYGQTVNDTISITVVDVVPVSLVISGPTTALENGPNVNLVATVTYSDSSTAVVTNAATWGSSNVSVASVGTSTGVVVPSSNVVGDQPVVISASFVSDATTVNATYNMTVVESVKRPASIEITGPATVNEGSNTINLVATVTYDDATTAIVTSSSSWVSANNGVATVGAATGVVTSTDNVVGDTPVNVSVSYTENGVTVNDTYAVTVAEAILRPVSVVVSGPTTVNEGSNTINLVATVTYDDTSSVITTASVNGTWTSDAPAIATVGAATGVVTSASNIVGNQVANVTYSYTENGVTVNDVYAITVAEAILRPVSVVVSGPTVVAEGSNTINLAATVTYEDASSAVTTASVNGVWGSSNNSIATVDSNGLVTSASDIVGNQAVNITYSYTENGDTVNDTYSITVTEAIKRPASIAITGPVTVSEGSNTINLVATVTYDDATTLDVTTASTWSSSDNAVATIGAATGVVTSANSVIGNQPVDISISYTESGVTVTDTYSITVTEGALTPVSVAITGPITVSEGSNTINLVATVTYDDTSTAVVTTTGAWTSTNSAVATIGASTGVVTSASNIVGDQAVSFDFSYTENSVTVNAVQHNVTVVESILRPVSVVITGPASADEGSVAGNFAATVTYDDTSTAVVTTTGTWSSDNVALVVVPSTGAYTTAQNVVGNQSVTVTFTYTENGATVNDTHAFTVNEVAKTPVSIAITGSATVSEGANTSPLTATVTYDDATTLDVTTTSTWSSGTPAVATIGASTGLVTSALDIVGNQPVVLSVSYTENGQTVNNTHNMTVVEAIKRPTAITITGPTTIAEGSNTANLTATVTYDDATTANVTVSSAWTSDVPAIAAVGAATGVVTSASDIIGNQAAVISVSYTENSVTVTDTHNMTVTEAIKRPVSVAITGPITVNEGSNTINLVSTVTYDDATTSVTTSSVNGTWGSSNNGIATVGTTTGVVTSANSVVGNQAVTINYSYTENGQTVNSSHNMTVVEAIKRPSSIVITGPTSVNEGSNTINLVATVTYDDSTTAVVTSSSTWTSSSPVVATVGAATGVVTSASNVLGNQVTTITVSYTESGQTVNDTHVVTVVESIKRPASVVITGPTAVDEGSNTINLVATVTYDDSTTAVRTTTGTWSSSNNTVATVGASTGVLTSAADVASNTNVTITFSYTENSVTVNDTHVVTVNNVTVTIPKARFGYGIFAGPNLDQNGFTGPQSIMDTVLTSQVTDNVDMVTFLGAGGDGSTTYGYFAYPVELGLLAQSEFQDTSNLFTGGWEGIDGPFDAAVPYVNWTPDGPNIVSMSDGSGVRNWYIYRTDFPIQNLTFRVINWPNV